MISAKIVYNLEKPGVDVPLCFLVVDYKHNFSVMSVYHMSAGITEQLRSGSQVFIKNPHLVLVQLQFKGYQYNY